MSRTENKSFFDLYAEQKKKPTPAQTFIAEVAALTHRSENTVKMWLCGRQIPDELMCNYWDARGLIPEMSKTMQEEDDAWE